jgi:hypothetical protein
VLATNNALRVGASDHASTCVNSYITKLIYSQEIETLFFICLGLLAFCKVFQNFMEQEFVHRKAIGQQNTQKRKGTYINPLKQEREREKWVGSARHYI